MLLKIQLAGKFWLHFEIKGILTLQSFRIFNFGQSQNGDVATGHGYYGNLSKGYEPAS
jgi:hypothetical protein